jgi:ATP-dependent RNA helicase DOB1
MGMEPQIIQKLGNALESTGFENLFNYTVEEWINWFIEWLADDASNIGGMFPGLGAQSQLVRALGLKKAEFTLAQIALKINDLNPIMAAYISGADYQTINRLLPGKTDAYLSKARNFILKLVPHFSFAFGVISIIIREKSIEKGRSADEIPYQVKTLATLIREGLDSESKLRFKMLHSVYTRVQVHEYSS